MRILRTVLAAIFAAVTFGNAMADSTESQRYVGGDISMLTYFEESNAIYYDTDGTKITDLMSYFSSQNLNAMRVRLFHDYTQATSDNQDSGARQDLEYVKALGKRIKDAGFAFMLDFHYSDTWADPTHQWIPKAWEGLSDDVLCDSIYNYTVRVLNALINAGATPDFIQIGNEISYGMLWDSQSGASTSNKYCAGTTSTESSVYTRFVNFLTYAAKGCRDACSDAKIVVHTERVPNSTYLKTFYSDVSSIDYDIIGLSYYPYYHGTLSTLESSLKVLESNFSDKEIMIVEYGFPLTYWPGDATYASSYFSDYDYTSDSDGNGAFTTDLIELLDGHEQVTGLFWWFMEGNEYNNGWSNSEYVRPSSGWYNMSLFNNSTGYVLSSMALLQDFLGETLLTDGDTYTLYFINDASWKTVNLALYDSDWNMLYDSFWDNSATPSGIAMTECCTDGDYTVYKYSFTYSDDEGEPQKLIFFNDGGASKTGNLTPSNGASYNSSGKVSSSASYTCDETNSSTTDSELYVYFIDDGTYSWTSICIVCYEVSGSTWNMICGTSWSSSSTMTEYCTTTDGYTVYKWTYSDTSTTPTKVQFFNNGGYGDGNQTDAVAYTNGATYSFSGAVSTSFECTSTAIAQPAQVNDNHVVRYYTIGGQYVGTSTDNLPRGLYVTSDGEKVVVR